MIILYLVVAWLLMGLIGMILEVKYGNTWDQLTVGRALFGMLLAPGAFAHGMIELLNSKFGILDKVVYTPKGK